jgi:hypothetical protein
MLGLAISSSTTLAIAMEQAKPERRGARWQRSYRIPLSNGVGAPLRQSCSMGRFFWMYASAPLSAQAILITTSIARAKMLTGEIVVFMVRDRDRIETNEHELQ